jgi:hypothetical protein
MNPEDTCGAHAVCQHAVVRTHVVVAAFVVGLLVAVPAAVAHAAGGGAVGGRPGASDSTPGSPTTHSVGYWVAGSDVASADAFGDAVQPTPGAVIVPSAPVVGITADPAGFGYWTVSADGNVYPFGEATSHGTAVAVHPVAPIVAIVSTRSGQGYWLAGRDGGIFTFGDAPFYGSGIDEDPSPVVGLAPTGFHTDPGYLIAHSDGSVFLHVAGSSSRLNPPILGLVAPIVGIASTPSEMGYYLAAADGGVFTFGDAHFGGSLGGIHLNAPVTGITARYDGGYWLVAADNGVFSFGGAPFLGTLEGTAHAGAGPAVGMAATPDPTAPLQ